MSNGTLTSVDTKPLSAHETQAFEHCCKVVDDKLKDFIEVGEALMTLKEGKLYRVKYPGRTWEQFVNERWNFTRQRAFQLINASVLARELETTVSIPNERVARAFLDSELKDDPEALRFAATLAATTAPGKLTEEWALSTIAMVLDAQATGGLVDNGNGDWAQANAAITAEAHKRMIEKRQQFQAGKQKPILNVKMSVRDLSGGIDLDGLDADATVRVVIYEDVSK